MSLLAAFCSLLFLTRTFRFSQFASGRLDELEGRIHALGATVAPGASVAPQSASELCLAMQRDHEPLENAVDIGGLLVAYRFVVAVLGDGEEDSDSTVRVFDLQEPGLRFVPAELR